MHSLSAPHEHQHQHSYPLHDTEEAFTVNNFQLADNHRAKLTLKPLVNELNTSRGVSLTGPPTNSHKQTQL